MNIGLFIPCYVNQFYPKVAIATLSLLEKLNCNVVFPIGQTCCGQPIANSGMEAEAIPIYHHYVKTFLEYDYIVAPSASCVYHVRHHYDVLDQTKEVSHVRNKTLDIAEFLLDVMNINALNAIFPYRVGLHQSCHGLRGLKLASPSELISGHFSKWEQLLGMVDGLELMPLQFPNECCGFGGTFSVMEEAVSIKMGRDRIKDHLDNQVQYITSGDMSCLMHLDGIIKRQGETLKTIHLVEILTANG